MNVLVKKKCEVLKIKSISWQDYDDSKFEFIYINTEGQNFSVSSTMSMDFLTNINYNNIELSDGKLYKKEELVIGIENIREYKIKNIIK
jgi:hypothetical protein